VFEALSGRFDAAEALADEALRLAMTAGDEWEIAMSAFAKALAASNIVALRERVERAQSLLAEVGNVYHLANHLASTAYGALGWGEDRDAKQLIERAVVIARELDDPSIWLTVHGNSGSSRCSPATPAPPVERSARSLGFAASSSLARFASERLRGLAAVAAASGEEDRAAQLVGASDAQRYGQDFEAVEARLDAAFFDAAAPGWAATVGSRRPAKAPP
jgi:hypothetical protein